MPDNRRRFSRIHFQTDARLYLPSGEFDVEVLDLSLKGALVKPHQPLFTPVGSNGSLRIRLDEMGTTIAMEITLVHREGDLFGLYCREIDLDSATHLRRLVELNVGDEAILHREITAFYSQSN